MKKKIIVLLFILLLIGCYPRGINTVFALPLNKEALTGTYVFKGDVPHFFTHEVIANPVKAFSVSNKLRYHYDKDCIDHSEFEKFLEQMYYNDYCLIDIYDTIGYENEIPYKKDIVVPIGKKPFLLSYDDMSYDSIDSGLVDKIILDENDNLASFTSSSSPEVEYNKDALPLLENFISSHPDFSYKNARAIICSTGYNGLLGYRINKTNKDYLLEQNQITPVINKLKKLNYHFACHTFNHISVPYSSSYDLEIDLKKYEEQIIPFIGKTNLFCFPCGAKTADTSKLSVLKQYGYNTLLCVGLCPDYQINNNVIYLSRKVLDGNSLRNFGRLYKEFFDTQLIYDNENRFIKM